MHIFLIRHGQSHSNTGDNFIQRLPDHMVSLTLEGKEQARKMGVWLKQYCDDNGIDLSNARIWRSPFLRTRQTSEEFNKSLHISDIKEDVTLIERQYGLFDALPENEWKIKYPIEYEEHQRMLENGGWFYSRFPLGESPFDVTIRIHQFLGTIARDYEKHGIDTLFVFTHGCTLRAFLMRYFHYSPEWMDSEKNPNNCDIREIDNYVDKGYINKDVKF